MPVLLFAVLLTTAACMAPKEPDGSFLSFLKSRQRWQTDQVTVSLSSSQENSGWTLSLVADHPDTGEKLNFLVLAPSLEGTHPLQVFGMLAADDGKSLIPVSNACPSGGTTTTSGSLVIERHDAENKSLDGSFIANICRVDAPEETWTLADGKFRRLTYP